MRTELIDEFIVLSHFLNFSAAARKLHTSQSNLSKHIAELENELGVLLISRKKPLSLTPAGVAFQERILPAHHMLNEAIEYCREVATRTREIVLIQEPYVMDAASEVVYKAVKALRSQHDDTFVRFFTEAGKKSTDSLETDTIDIALTVESGNLEHIEQVGRKKNLLFYPLVKENLVAWVRKDGPFGKLDSITVPQLLETQVNMTATRCFDPMRFAVRNMYLAETGQRPFYRTISADSLSLFFTYTSDIDTVFIITPSVARLPLLHQNDEMKTIPIDSPHAVLYSLIAVKADYSKESIDQFLDALKAVVEPDMPFFEIGEGIN